MMHIPEFEKILHFEYIVIKPVGIGAAIGSSQSSSTFNKGHIVNAGILYILESGMMKIISTTGALLLEKNIAFDINESGEMGGENQIVSIVTSPNPEDMHFALLTKNGKIIKYQIKLDRQVDTSQFIKEEASIAFVFASQEASIVEIDDGEKEPEVPDGKLTKA
jgi:hypothetical protein